MSVRYRWLPYVGQLNSKYKDNFWEVVQWPLYTGWLLYTGPLYTGSTVGDIQCTPRRKVCLLPFDSGNLWHLYVCSPISICYTDKPVHMTLKVGGKMQVSKNPSAHPDNRRVWLVVWSCRARLLILILLAFILGITEFNWSCVPEICL